ncbi:MAG: hypothetical protein CMH55_06360 [Myxococcales bacterium]|nr:hypothetical protein [Myxococcales bacterium]
MGRLFLIWTSLGLLACPSDPATPSADAGEIASMDAAQPTSDTGNHPPADGGQIPVTDTGFAVDGGEDAEQDSGPTADGGMPSDGGIVIDVGSPPAADGGPLCGNGVIDEGETCDDGNDDDRDACPGTCQEAYCGDGFRQRGEERCDDGNDDNTDGCVEGCVFADCGDGFVRAGREDCDDGNDDNGDGCTGTCQLARCGDGFLRRGLEPDDEGYEACDDGRRNNDDRPDACRTNCLAASCGDEVIDDGELCDDGNNQADDGCSPACVPEGSTICSLHELGILDRCGGCHGASGGLTIERNTAARLYESLRSHRTRQGLRLLAPDNYLLAKLAGTQGDVLVNRDDWFRCRDQPEISCQNDGQCPEGDRCEGFCEAADELVVCSPEGGECGADDRCVGSGQGPCGDLCGHQMPRGGPPLSADALGLIEQWLALENQGECLP